MVGEFVRHVGRLVEIQTVPPKPQPPPIKDYIFEDIEARCEIRLNGKTIKEIQTFNDFYGLGTGVKSAINEMREYATKEGLGPKNDIEIVVIRIVRQFVARPKDQENFYDRTFFDFQPIVACSCSEHEQSNETIVWSSKNANP